MERGRKNKVRNKFRMSSPFKQTGSATQEVYGGGGGHDDKDPSTTTTENVDKARNKQKVDKALKDAENIKKANTDVKYDPATGNIIGESEPKGIDRWIDKPIMEVLGLTKEQRTARKEKKAAKIEDAKKAESEGTETLKQAKLVKRAKKREDRALKRKIKDQKKLKKFREKNPVTGKEAIKLATKE